MFADGRDPATLRCRRIPFNVYAQHLYIHVPFCARRCVYCDFSIAVRGRVPVAEYLLAVDTEWRLRHRDSRFELNTLYFGGGTPSKLGGDGVAGLIDLVRSRARVKVGAEVTLEANPDDVTPDVVRAWQDAGVNRVSLGVQSFDDSVLRWMHRTHDAQTAIRSLKVLREGGIPNVSIDLIFAVPAAQPRDWLHDVERAIALDLPHLSVYGLTVESQTPLGRWVARRDVAEATEDVFEREFLGAHRLLTAAGYEHYEVSNYAKPGKRSRHNTAYWMRQPYAGLGPSAHEFDGSVRRWNVGGYVEWLARSSCGLDTTAGFEALDEGQRTAEEVYLSLRTSAGLKLNPSELGRAHPLVDARWASISSDGTLRLAGAGWLRLDSIATHLTTLRSR